MSRGISFFGKSYSGLFKIRGQQMAERLNGKVNPTEEYEEDLCVFIGDRPQISLPRMSVLDPGDWITQWNFIRRHPGVKVLASSLPVQKMFASRFRRDIEYIPDHHCNYERERRPERPVQYVGIVGNYAAVLWDLEDLRDRFRHANLHLLPRIQPATREETMQAYRAMDIQIVFRKGIRDMALKDALKLSNAGSFGIPTVAYPEPAYLAEYEGAFLPVQTIEALVDGVVTLSRNPDLYRRYAETAHARAAAYHIDEIGKRYREWAEGCGHE